MATRAAWPADAGTMIRVLKRNGNEVAEPQDNMEWHRLLELMAAEQNQANGGQTSEYSHKFPMKVSFLVVTKVVTKSDTNWYC